jgi:predicted nucleotidyltransferase
MTTRTVHYPGTAQHQALLRAIVAHYGNDPRVLTVIVFGSLGRGDWDVYSDIDLDIVISDSVKLDPLKELRRLCESFAPLGERVALITPDGKEGGDVVLESLMQLSVRYHTVAQTSPNIVKSMKVLAGSVGEASIVAAGEANRRATDLSIHQLLDQCIRYAATVRVCLLRERVWLTIELLHRMRGLLMQIFSRTHRGERAWQAFERQADRTIQARLGATLSLSDLPALRQALNGLLDILENNLDYLSADALQLTDTHRAVIHRIRADLAGVSFGAGLHPSSPGKVEDFRRLHL